jgi:hypothetical protein
MSLAVLDAGPDYFETYFPKDAFPNYGWSNLPLGLPAQAWTTETTHRDSQQGGLPFTAKQHAAVYQILCDFTGQKSGAFGKWNSLSTGRKTCPPFWRRYSAYVASARFSSETDFCSLAVSMAAQNEASILVSSAPIAARNTPRSRCSSADW